MARKEITPTKKQIIATDLILSNKYTDILFDGAARAGKTFNIIVNLIFFTFKHEKLRILIAREKLSHIISSLWLQTLIPVIEEYFPDMFDVNKSYHIITKYIIMSIPKKNFIFHVIPNRSPQY